MFTKTLQKIQSKTGDRASEVWRRFLTMSFCALSYGTREGMYHDAIKRYKDKPEVLELYAKAFAELVQTYQDGERYYDHLGDYHMSLQSPKAAQHSGEYFTPVAVADLMARTTVTDLPDDRPLSLHEPTAGSGRMALAVVKMLEHDGYDSQCVTVNAWDLSELCFFMCYINLTLWAIPAEVVHGNTLSLEVFKTQRTPVWVLAHPPVKHITENQAEAA